MKHVSLAFSLKKKNPLRFSYIWFFNGFIPIITLTQTQLYSPNEGRLCLKDWKLFSGQEHFSGISRTCGLVCYYTETDIKKTKNKQIFIRLKRVTTSPSSLYIFCIWLILYCISYATVFVNSVDRFSAALLDNSLSRINDVRTFGVLK